MTDIQALYRALTDKTNTTEEERIALAGQLREAGGAQVVDLLRQAFCEETLKVQIAIGRELNKIAGADNVDFFIAEMEKGTSCAAYLLKETGDVRAFRLLMAYARKHFNNSIWRQIVDDYARRNPLDELARREYEDFSRQMDEWEEHGRDPRWVLEALPYPENGRGGETIDQILSKVGGVECYSPGASSAEFVVTYNGLREYHTVRRTGKDAWEILDKRIEQTDW